MSKRLWWVSGISRINFSSSPFSRSLSYKTFILIFWKIFYLFGTAWHGQCDAFLWQLKNQVKHVLRLGKNTFYRSIFTNNDIHSSLYNYAMLVSVSVVICLPVKTFKHELNNMWFRRAGILHIPFNQHFHV